MSANSSSTAATVVGMVVASCTLCYTAVAASRSVPGLFSEAPATTDSRIRSASSDSDEKQVKGSAPRASDDSLRLLDAEHGACKYAEAHNGGVESPIAKPQAYSMWSSFIFLLTLVLASLYSAMVLTNWAENAEDVVTTKNSASSMWAQVRCVEFRGLAYCAAVIAQFTDSCSLAVKLP